MFSRVAHVEGETLIERNWSSKKDQFWLKLLSLLKTVLNVLLLDIVLHACVSSTYNWLLVQWSLCFRKRNLLQFFVVVTWRSARRGSPVRLKTCKLDPKRGVLFLCCFFTRAHNSQRRKQGSHLFVTVQLFQSVRFFHVYHFVFPICRPLFDIYLFFLLFLFHRRSLLKFFFLLVLSCSLPMRSVECWTGWVGWKVKGDQMGIIRWWIGVGALVFHWIWEMVIIFRKNAILKNVS